MRSVVAGLVVAWAYLAAVGVLSGWLGVPVLVAVGAVALTSLAAGVAMGLRS